MAWALLLGSMAMAAAADAPPTSAVHARYVVLGSLASGETVAWARVVVDPGYACPTVTGGTRPLPMALRSNSYPFPVVVCEARIGFDQDLEVGLSDGTLSLPRVTTDPETVAVFGDTGCKAPKPGSSEGCPWGTPAEPFHTLASAAAEGAPDLVLHMGDYNYRGTSVHFYVENSGDEGPGQTKTWTYDAGDGSTAGQGCEQGSGAGFLSQSAADGNFPDSWAAWRDDFFSAAGDLLAAAPWVVARGNHELCSRAGPGFFYFLDPHSDLDPGGAQLSCPPPLSGAAAKSADPRDFVVLSQPYAVSLGNLSLLVVDNANACDSFQDPAFTAIYTAQMKRLQALAPASTETWLIGHRPIWGVTEFSSTESTACTSAEAYGCINQTLQAALTADGAGASGLPPTVTLSLAGHMHRFQAVTFPRGDRPPQLVVGTGGVELDGSPPQGSFPTRIDGQAAQVLTTGSEVMDGTDSKAAFGYLWMKRPDPPAWTGKIVDPGEELILAVCGSAQADQGAVCRLGPGVSVPATGDP